MITVVDLLEDALDRKQAEEVLRKNELEKVPILDSLSEIVVFYGDNNLKIEWLNRAAGESVGLSTDKLASSHCYEIWNNRKAPCKDCPVLKTFETGKPHESEMTSPDGKIWRVRGYPVLSEKDKIEGVVEVVQNITERKRAEKVLKESERKYRELAESIDNIFFAMDNNFKYTFWNKASEKLSGISSKQALGKSLYDIFPDIKGTKIDNLYLDTIKKQKPHSMEYYYSVKDRDYAFEINVYPSKDGLSVFQKNITERKWAEKALQAEHFKLETRLKHESLLAEVASSLNSTDSFQDIMNELLSWIGKTMGVDSASFYRYDVNYEAATRLSNWSSNSGQQKLEFPPKIPCSRIPNFSPRLIANESVILSNVSELEIEEKNFFADLDTKALIICPLSIVNLVKGLVCFNYQNEHIWSPEEINIYKTIADMIVSAWERDSQFNARLEVEKKYTKTIRLTEKTSRLAYIGVMAAGITHEINQPLTIIRVIADSMILQEEDNKGLLTGNLRKNFIIISDSVKKIDRIIRQMRSFGESQDKTALETIDLNESVKNTVSLISHQLFSHEIDLQFDLEDAPLPFQGNRIYMEQIVINLVTNAMQALDICENKDKIIRIITSRGKNSAILKVKDNGPGFSEKVGNNIFEPFFSTKRSIGGTGLGLAIAKSFVERFGGSIRAKKGKTGGATFIVRFPMSQSI